MKFFFKSLYFTNRFFLIVIGIVLFFVFGFFYPLFYLIAQYALSLFAGIAVVDAMILFQRRRSFFASRKMMDKLSNGDENAIQIIIKNSFAFPVKVKIIDELPFQFQSRKTEFFSSLEKGEKKIIQYHVRPVKRGEYHFGAVNVFATSPIGFIQRRFKFSQDITVPVYPSFIQMRKYELLAISNRLTEAGVKKVRKFGMNREFEQIKEYVQGDDYRTINWKATARRSRLMVNQYEDEKSQQVYSLIDMGRVMRMPFNGMTLLDYAINASLVISNIAMNKHDKAGVVTFSHKVQSVLAADRKTNHLQKILELLYRQKTGFLESDYERLYASVRKNITTRSLFLLFTNFESLSGMQRQLKYLKRMAKDHLLVVIFFENTELKKYISKPASNVEEIYAQTIAEKFSFEKKRIVKELEKSAIHSILTAPENLSVNTINKYLELKARGLL